jgi:hypothetical protein
VKLNGKVVLKATLKAGSIYHFTNDSFENKAAHFQVVLNNCPIDDKYIICVCATSKVKKRRDWVARVKFPPETLVEIAVGTYSFFTKPTVFDCNGVQSYSPGELIKKYDENALRHFGYLQPQHLEMLKKGVKMSPRIERGIKKLV